MLIDFRDYISADPIRADICIVGGGAAGITLAHKLAATGKQICLLESGGQQPDTDTQALYNNSSVGFSGGDGCRLRYFGGTTNHWASWSMPLSPWALESRDWVANSGWPITYADLEPWYQQAHKILELGEFAYDRASMFGDASVPDLPPELRWVFFRIAQNPVRFADKYGDELAVADNVSVYLHANLTHFEAAVNGDRVRRAHVRSLSGVSATVEATTYVLACGAWENARLLLLSDDVNPAGLGNDHDVVGRYLMQHPDVKPGATIAFTDPLGAHSEFVLKRFRDGELKYKPACSPTLQAQRDRSLLDSMVMLIRDGESYIDEDADWFAGQLAVLSEWWNDGGDTPIAVDSRNYGEGRFGIMVEQVPDPDSRLTLGQRIDALGQRESVIDWRISEQHNHTVRTLVDMVGSAYTAAGVGRVHSIDHDYDYRNIKDGPWGGCHHMGTTRMGSDPSVSVVNPDCRVHGVDNLYIAGSSVFPAVGYANPTMTLVALALRLAEHLEQLPGETPVTV